MIEPNSEPPKPDDEFVIQDLETLKVMADPLRIQMLEAMGDRVCTVKQIAADLNIPPTKLYYHFKQLEEHGLIRVVDTRLVSGIVEKLYQVRAHGFRVDRGLFSPGSPDRDKHLNLMLSTMFDATRDDFKRSIDAGLIGLTNTDDEEDSHHRDSLLSRTFGRMSPERAIAFRARLEALMKEFGEDEEGDGNEHNYVLLLAIYPTVRSRSSTDNP